MMLAWMLLAVIPMDAVVLREEVACVEKNRFYDDSGRLVFVQWIFYEEVPSGCLSIVAWRLDKGEFSFQERPPVLTFSDADTMRQVRAAYWRESWTQTDPELEARERLPSERRRGLRKK